ncbi:iron uptake system protein EfeO [Moraxella oculi]|uniref:Iron uptake system protein EfeO n=1 Tax=Moraxella oculi TaxID=2940516 RepID=A0ABW8U6V7_9GAMM
MKTVKSTLVIALSALLLTACGDNKPAETKTEVSTQTQAEQVSIADLSAETAEYKKWVEGQMDGLVTDTEKFVSLLKAGKTDEAKALYPLVRMYFERSEPIAESFGDLDPRIDNREADLEKDEKWTGFHAIEKILWTKNTTKGTEMLADQLLADTKELRAKIPTAEVTPDLMIQGAVDLLNEVTTTKITGEEEIFSKTDLYDFKANIEGAQKIFQILTPKIEAKNPELVADLKAKFAEVHALLDVHKINEQHYKDYDELSKDEIKALAEAVNKLGEPLAQMGVVMQ